MTYRLYIAALAFVSVVLPGCVTTSKGPAPPDFSERQSRIVKNLDDLERARTTIERDIAGLRSASGAFFESDPSLYDDPFPLDLFRHTAMACLNTPVEPRIDVLPRYREAAEEAGITCAVAPTAPLLDVLSEAVPGERRQALERLQLIDEWRRIRGRMQDRLRQLPRFLEQTREWIASRRAAARQTEIELERRRAEYSPDRLEAARDAINNHRDQLSSLEQRMSQIESAIPPWSRAVAAEIDYVYSRLSLLGPLGPT
jgi:hypothetical protein